MSKIAGELVVPQEAELVVELDGSNGLGEVGHNSLEELVVDCQADEQLEFVVLSKAATGCLYPGYQPELVEGKNKTSELATTSCTFVAAVWFLAQLTQRASCSSSILDLH